MLTRRQTTAALLAAPFFGLLGKARAQGGAPRARRLLVFSSPNGTIHRHWRPQGGERDFVFAEGSILEPLTAWRDRLLVVDGLNFLTGNNHEGGQSAMLTNGGGLGTPTRGASVDQFLGRRLGAMDRFASLEFGVLTDIWGANIQTRMSYSEAGQLVHPADLVHQRLLRGQLLRPGALPDAAAGEGQFPEAKQDQRRRQAGEGPP